MTSSHGATSLGRHLTDRATRPWSTWQAVTWATGLLVGRGVEESSLAFLGTLLERELREYPLAHAMVVQHWT